MPCGEICVRLSSDASDSRQIHAPLAYLIFRRYLGGVLIASAGETVTEHGDGADGATAPETLRPKDRAAGTSGERRFNAPTDGDVVRATPRLKLSGTRTDGA